MSNKIYKVEKPTNELVKIKHHGQIFTPDYLVEDILDLGHYILGNINKKHVIDNSCGDGQFMVHIIDRYCRDFLTQNNDLTLLKRELEEYIHAIEIQKDEFDICIDRCNQLVQIYGIENVKWDFINGNALQIFKFDKKIDFCLGNPPYVRVHNLDENFSSVKSFEFCNIGMTDLYIVFYEIGLRMLNQNGILCYITPSSFFTSLAGSNMRKYFGDKKILESICDLKHFQPFNAITYTTIVCLNKTKTNAFVDYYEFNEKKLKPTFIERLNIKDYQISGQYYFSYRKNLDLLKKILNNTGIADLEVKNGYATLADNIFIRKFDFESKFIIPVVKSSRAQKNSIFYPYNKNGEIVLEEELQKDKNIYSYLQKNEIKLKNRSIEKGSKWYAFGRSQGVKDTWKDKISINTLIKKSEDLKIVDLPSGTGCYSGLYIISSRIPFSKIKEALIDPEFGIFVALLGKYKSGGFYTFSSKDVKIYLNYKIGCKGLFDVKNK